MVVRALQHAAAHGLPGNHHFYLTFRTDYPGVALPARLKAQYPLEMTIGSGGACALYSLQYDGVPVLINVDVSPSCSRFLHCCPDNQ